MPDLTKLFQSAFGKYEAIKKGGYQGNPLDGNNIPTKIMSENTTMTDAYNTALYPEKIGQKKREEKLKAQNEYEEFVKSITEDEYNNLFILNKDRVLMSKDQLIAMAEEGEDLGIDRLEKTECVKREKVDDFIEFRITGKGKKIFNELNKRMGR